MSDLLTVYLIAAEDRSGTTIRNGFYLEKNDAVAAIKRKFDYWQKQNPPWLEWREVPSTSVYLVSADLHWRVYRLLQIDRHDAMRHFLEQEAIEGEKARRGIL
jgi:hypothetical protein